MNNDSENIDLSDPVDSFAISSVVHPECSVVGISCNPDSVWIQVIFFACFFQFYLITVSHSDF